MQMRDSLRKKGCPAEYVQPCTETMTIVVYNMRMTKKDIKDTLVDKHDAENHP